MMRRRIAHDWSSRWEDLSDSLDLKAFGVKWTKEVWTGWELFSRNNQLWHFGKGDCKKALAVCKRQYKYCAYISVKKSLEHISNALCLRNTKPNDWSLFSKNSDLIYLAKDVIRKVFGVMSTPRLLKMAIKSMEKRSYEAFQEEMDFSINYSLPSVVIPLYQMSLFKPKSINFLPKTTPFHLPNHSNFNLTQTSP